MRRLVLDTEIDVQEYASKHAMIYATYGKPQSGWTRWAVRAWVTPGNPPTVETQVVRVEYDPQRIPTPDYD